MSQVENSEVYTGAISGRVNEDSGYFISAWKAYQLRCPVVIEAWREPVRRAGLYRDLAGVEQRVAAGVRGHVLRGDLNALAIRETGDRCSCRVRRKLLDAVNRTQVDAVSQDAEDDEQEYRQHNCELEGARP